MKKILLLQHFAPMSSSKKNLFNELLSAFWENEFDSVEKAKTEEGAKVEEFRSPRMQYAYNNLAHFLNGGWCRTPKDIGIKSNFLRDIFEPSLMPCSRVKRAIFLNLLAYADDYIYDREKEIEEAMEEEE